MAIKKYVSGAWQECSTLKKYTSGAWQSCDYAKKYVSGAWQNVWTSSIKAIFGKSTLNASAGNLYCNGGTNGFNPYILYNQGNVMDGTGYVEYYVDGNWTNPTITFDWQGIFYNAYTSGGKQYWQSYKAGTITVLYGQTSWGSNLNTKLVVDTIRGTDSSGNYSNSYASKSWNHATGQVSTTLSGTFTRIGFRIKLNSYVEANPEYSSNNSVGYEGSNDIEIYNVKISGVNVDFPSASI